jgi:hypothetical protein
MKNNVTLLNTFSREYAPWIFWRSEYLNLEDILLNSIQLEYYHIIYFMNSIYWYEKLSKIFLKVSEKCLFFEMSQRYHRMRNYLNYINETEDFRQKMDPKTTDIALFLPKTLFKTTFPLINANEFKQNNVLKIWTSCLVKDN